jgi:hypothetical protein
VDEAGFLLWALGPATSAAWRWTGVWLDTQAVPFPGEPDRRCDTVAALEHRRLAVPPLAAVIEFMSEARRAFPERLADYCLAIRSDVPAQREPTVSYDVIGVVLLTGAPQPEVWQMAPPDCEGLGLWFRCKVRTLRNEDAFDTLSSIDLGEIAMAILAWVPLMAGADRPEVVAEWRRLAERKGRAEDRAVLAGLARIFAELAGRAGVWHKGLEDFNVLQSQFMQELRAISRAEGEAKGRAEGEAVGEVKGELRTRRSDLLLVLKTRHGEAAHDLVALAEAQSDLATLNRWFQAALTCDSLDELRGTFRMP